ncbi:XRE family transcriptional regulator [Alkalihalobacillus alcalophilus ATCC 27647 = CGMCC 1.3604]|uniref:Transcriptional regulator n=1 Tax=Alkalihalobacillus alcalophilus ATCC 27647 = CGMCC 1.3604 TaxID=1218173 RepID=A0A094XC03_ALKAL|nr:helix-turn-helix transcriptional regulator [Alkalihalobacillus alcalophilus]KGA96315.1 transcriptional regulator [Alkalihalobacillus alcalophilus ATCC 27647 = CGMCC 1.3604]MED1561713.1 helix-turn-helix transcriptional regulator [Alkalihalobacillus alcalophilus]THG92402.1 XRE family transcriptional regulator [Alkalihalobacillus alcalophilus ATCC 27647 = CGMCC 1.3604]
MDSELLGRKIRAFRKLKGYTQKSFAKELGISVSVLGEIERGNRVPDDYLIERIVVTLNITEEDIKSDS